ncbi:TetR/AcrR family transcriptional regulator [Saccharopolyspora sp. K220]|uniref:TetR/AcrR family transcriptional regulator n=1 Tax=Saccharopolyspora soli TaxID=2926618 RepID=UPI001F5AB722|nr:TetR/AcrR family transcriptional regulator [Saccharopolyspora soli]MCI2423353.1 TetR/AcrR family transcriptional regulator [Saccharopolyspora soli]
MDDAAVPPELRRLWRVPANSRMGRPAELDVDRVMRAAVELADQHGLAGVTLPKIAQALGFTTMSLYRYVGSKDELLVLMQDFAMGMPPEITVEPDDWCEGLRQWAAAERRVNHRHPWLAQVPVAGPPIGPNQISWMEAALRIMRATKLDWAQKIGVVMLISGYVRHTTLLSEELETGRAAGVDEPEATRRYGESLAKLISPKDFPEVAGLLASGVFNHSPGTGEDPAADPDFTFGLDRILDGIANLT